MSAHLCTSCMMQLAHGFLLPLSASMLSHMLHKLLYTHKHCCEKVVMVLNEQA